MQELETRIVPWQYTEVSWARNRPPGERVPLPHAGDVVWYRQWEWERDPGGRHTPPERATVVEVQDPTDTAVVHTTPDGVPARDPNLWHLLRDPSGKPLPGPGGGMVYAPVADPWPRVVLRRPNGVVVTTREARLRGSAGWLPLDYRTRPERTRLPSATMLVPRPGVTAPPAPVGR